MCDDGDESKYDCGGFFIKSNVLLLPRHFARSVKNFTKYRILTSTAVRCVSIDWRESDVSTQFIEFGDDFVAVKLTGVPPFRDVVDLFAKMTQKATFNGLGVEMCVKDCIRIQRFMEMSPYSHSYKSDGVIYPIHGYRGDTEVPMERGSCMCVVLKEGPSPEIVGFHLAGLAGRTGSIVASVTQSMLNEACEKLTKRSLIEDFVLDNTVQEYEGLSSQVHPLCPSNELYEGLPIVVHGSVPGSGPRKMSTEFTEFYSEVEEFIEPDVRLGLPIGRARRVNGILKSPWKSCLQQIAEAEDKTLHVSLAETANDILQHFRKGIDDYLEQGLLSRPMDLYEATNGIPGESCASGVTMKTAAGMFFGGKKLKHAANEEHPWIWKPYVEERVANFIECLKRGERPFNILGASLKDEPMKEKKIVECKTRVFYSDSLDALLVCMMYFTAPCNFMSMYNGFSQCALGLNAQSYDWHWLYKFLRREGSEHEIPDEDFICLDFKSFDQTLSEKLMQRAWWILVELTRDFPCYTDEDRKVMHLFARMKCTPYINFNGTLMQFFMLHTSGNGCTAHVGSLAGMILITMVCKDIMNENNVDCDVFDILRSIHLGDDCVISIRKDLLPQYTFIELQKRLKEYGVHITMPDKEAEPTEYQNIKEHDFLKRKFVYCEDRQCVVGPIDKNSFMKSLGFILPSKSVSRRTQYESTFNNVLVDAALHGEEFYNEMRAFLLKICEEYGLKPSLINKSYEKCVVDFAKESGRRYPEYQKVEKPFVEKAFMSGNYDEQTQIDALGKVVKPFEHVEEEEIVPMSARGNRIVRVCKKCMCLQFRGVEEEMEDDLTSNRSGLDKSKNDDGILDDSSKHAPDVPAYVLVPSNSVVAELVRRGGS